METYIQLLKEILGCIQSSIQSLEVADRFTELSITAFGLIFLVLSLIEDMLFTLLKAQQSITPFAYSIKPQTDFYACWQPCETH